MLRQTKLQRRSSAIFPPSNKFLTTLLSVFRSVFSPLTDPRSYGATFCISHDHCRGAPHKSENNLRTKHPKHGAITRTTTQITARRFNTMAFLRKSAGCRFESCPAHQLFPKHFKNLGTFVLCDFTSSQFAVSKKCLVGSESSCLTSESPFCCCWLVATSILQPGIDRRAFCDRNTRTIFHRV